MSGAAGDRPTLEGAMARLDEVTQRLEGTELELTESLALYEEGIRLVRLCDELMAAAEERVHRLRADGEGFRLDAAGEAP